MSTLLFLSDREFLVTNHPQGTILCNRIRGLSLILFYSNQCKYCPSFVNVFKRLPGSIAGCEFGVVNISVGNNRQIVEMAKSTISPIKYVPLVILYVNGRPTMKYDGPDNDNEIRRFIVEVSNKLNTKQQFTAPQNNPQFTVKQKENRIPAYCVGKPIKGGKKDKVCYLEWNNAYVPGSNPSQKRGGGLR